MPCMHVESGWPIVGCRELREFEQIVQIIGHTSQPRHPIYPKPLCRLSLQTLGKSITPDAGPATQLSSTPAHHKPMRMPVQTARSSKIGSTSLCSMSLDNKYALC
ncbi:hypothetical protein ABBQ32_001159 [Trebouxia sp. C0010 RCD-2024]